MPRNRPFGFIDPLPNEKSAHQTTTSRYIDLYYANLRLIDRWTWDRYARFCQATQMTAYEMASLVLMRHSTIQQFQARNRISGHDAPAIAMLLTLLEAQLLKNLSLDIVTNAFPDLSKK